MTYLAVNQHIHSLLGLWLLEHARSFDSKIKSRDRPSVFRYSFHRKQKENMKDQHKPFLTNIPKELSLSR